MKLWRVCCYYSSRALTVVRTPGIHVRIYTLDRVRNWASLNLLCTIKNIHMYANRTNEYTLCVLWRLWISLTIWHQIDERFNLKTHQICILLSYSSNCGVVIRRFLAFQVRKLNVQYAAEWVILILNLNSNSNFYEEFTKRWFTHFWLLCR